MFSILFSKTDLDSFTLVDLSITISVDKDYVSKRFAWTKHRVIIWTYSFQIRQITLVTSQCLRSFSDTRIKFIDDETNLTQSVHVRIELLSESEIYSKCFRLLLIKLRLCIPLHQIVTTLQLVSGPVFHSIEENVYVRSNLLSAGRESLRCVSSHDRGHALITVIIAYMDKNVTEMKLRQSPTEHRPRQWDSPLIRPYSYRKAVSVWPRQSIFWDVQRLT